MLLEARLFKDLRMKTTANKANKEIILYGCNKINEFIGLTKLITK